MKDVLRDLSLLSQVVLDGVNTPDEKTVIKKFIHVALVVLKADFGFAWYKQSADTSYHWMYKTANTPYQPSAPRKHGVMARALKSRTPIFIEDLSKNNRVRGEAREHMASVAVIPVIYKNNVYGNLVICYKEKHVFIEKEKIFCGYISNNAGQSIAIHRLYKNLKTFKDTLDHTPEPVLILEPATKRITYHNASLLRLLLVPHSFLARAKVEKVIHPSFVKSFTKLIDQVLVQKISSSIFEGSLVGAQGKKIPVEMSVAYVNLKDQEPYILVVARDLRERLKSQEQIKYAAFYDMLTNLPNRHLFNDRLEKVLEQSSEYKKRFGLIFIDLDRFKFINDILGHTVGDQLLQEAALRLRASVKRSDTVSRLGGDEFVILLPNVQSTKNTLQVAERIKAAFDLPFRLDGQEVYINLSMGMSQYPRDGLDISTLLKNADTALYRAKEDGGNSYTEYHESIPSTLRAHSLNLDAEIRRALKLGQFEPYYHPQIEIASGKISGYEALIRWNHPKHGLLLPEKFINQAEETGLIVAIDKWVIAQALESHVKFKRMLGRGERLSINLSMRTLLEPDLVRFVKRALSATKVKSSELKFELTETVIMKNMDFSMEVLNEFKRMGINCLVDDFGIGYTSISYLKRLPIEGVKIDKSFIGGIGDNPHDEAIIKALISLAHEMRLRVLAEGVETAEQLRFLTELGCDYAQGHLFSPPLSEGRFLEWLDNYRKLQ